MSIKAASSAEPILTGLVSLTCSPPAPSSPNPPIITEKKDLFIATHMIYERIAPEEPTNAPVITRAKLFRVKPIIAAAKPE